MLLTTGAIQTFSKTAFGRARPSTEVGAYKFNPFTSRFYSGAHWLTDITFGGVLAWYAAETAYNQLEKNKFKHARGTPQTSLHIAPPLDGFLATLKF
jgi:hypothetical protein